MSMTTDDGLTQYGTGCFITVPIWQRRATKRFKFPCLLPWLSVCLFRRRCSLFDGRLPTGMSTRTQATWSSQGHD